MIFSVIFIICIAIFIFAIFIVIGRFKDFYNKQDDIYSKYDGVSRENNYSDYRCKYCGAKIESDSIFCKICGKEQ